jgi:glycosyltransferase involved in cell wall biosynthesis
MSTQKKHILINAIHSKTGGGLIFINHILPYLAKEKTFQVTVLAAKGYEDRIEHPKNITLKTVEAPKSLLKMLLWEQINIPKIATELKVDITFNLANYAPLFAPNNVLYITNNPEVRHFVPFKEKMYWHALIWMTRLSLLFAKKTFSNGTYVQDCYASGLWSFLKKKMVVATTACDKIDLPQKIQKNHEILAIGDYYPHKDYPLLLKAFAKVVETDKNIQLNIIGRPVHGSIEDNMKDIIKSKNLEKQVHLLGAMPSAETKKMLATSKLYVNPSHAETFSLTLLEAMTLGTASVVKNHPFHKEVAGEDGAYYVPVSNQSALNEDLWANAILKLLSDDKQRQHIEEVGHKKASHISWGNSAKTIVQHLKNKG